jgi:hypothetical protein
MTIDQVSERWKMMKPYCGTVASARHCSGALQTANSFATFGRVKSWLKRTIA